MLARPAAAIRGQVRLSTLSAEPVRRTGAFTMDADLEVNVSLADRTFAFCTADGTELVKFHGRAIHVTVPAIPVSEDGSAPTKIGLFHEGVFVSPSHGRLAMGAAAAT